MKTTRRKFIGAMAQMAAALGITTWPMVSFAKTTKEKMLVHQVYFWLKDPEDQQAFDQLKSGLEKILRISSIESVHIGVPATTEVRDVVDHSFSFSYQVRFKNVTDHDSYQEDPIHLQFIEECADLWDQVKVYDYNPL